MHHIHRVSRHSLHHRASDVSGSVTTMAKRSTLLNMMIYFSSIGGSAAAFGKCLLASRSRVVQNKRLRRNLSSASKSSSAILSAEEYDSRIRNHPLVGKDETVQDPSKPFFPIYYNDVYEVRLPANHRFPMDKYRKVRRLAQTLIASQTAEEQSQVVCGA